MTPFVPRQLATRLRVDQTAAAALEFGIVAPAFLAFLFAILGVGVIGFYQLVLDDAVRDATRQVQIDAPAAANAANFVAAVCAEFGLVVTDCTTSLTYSVQASTPAAGFGSLVPASLSGAGALNNAFFSSGTAYAARVNVLVQVAYPMPFTLPYIGALVTLTGTNSILSSASARAEPFN